MSGADDRDDRDADRDFDGGMPGGAAIRDPEALVEHVRRVRLGHGANCSSIGSVVDTLFVTATVGAAVFAAVVSALAKESTKVVPARKAPPERPPRGERSP